MGYVENNLLENEAIVYKGKIHGLYTLISILFILFGILFLMIGVKVPGIATMIGLAVAACKHNP